MADRLELVHELGVGKKLRHRSEGEPAEVLVEAARNHAQAAIRELETRRDDRGLEELRLVDPHDVEARCPPEELRDRIDRDGAHPRPSVADDIGLVVAVVYLRLEDDGSLASDLGAAKTPDHLLALPAEHRSADDLEPAASLGWDTDHGRDP